jgi:hypothetical protein
MRVTSRSALKKAAEVMPDVRKKSGGPSARMGKISVEKL